MGPLDSVTLISVVILTLVFPGAATLRYLHLWNSIEKVGRWSIAIALSLLISPALLWIVGHFFPLSALAGAATLTIYCLALETLSLRSPGTALGPFAYRTVFDSKGWGRWILVGALLVLLLLSLAQTDGVKPLFCVHFDFIKHDALIYSLAGSRLPPENPFFHPGTGIPLSYYYLFHLIPALFVSAGGLLPGNALLVAVFFAALGFLGSATMWAHENGAQSRNLLLIAVLLSFVGGLECVFFPQILRATDFKSVFPSLGWLNELAPKLTLFHLQIAPFSGYTLPHVLVIGGHHVVALMAIFVLPILFSSVKEPGKLIPIMPLIVLSIVGSSIYVAVLGVACFAVWVLFRKGAIRRVDLFPQGGRLEWGALAGMAVGVFLIGWFLFEIWPAANTKTAGLEIALPRTVIFFPLDHAGNRSWWAAIADGALAMMIGHGVLLVPVLFGLFTGVRYRIARWHAAVLVASALLALFGRSTGLDANDFASKANLCFRICLVFMTAEGMAWLWSGRRRLAMTATVMAICAAGIFTALEFYWLGPFRIMRQVDPTFASAQFVDAATYLKQNTPSGAIVQMPPRERSYQYMVARRRSVILDHAHGALFNVDPRTFARTETAIAWFFDHLDDRRSRSLAEDLGIEYLMVSTTQLPKSDSLYRPLYRNQRYAILEVLRSKPSSFNRF